MEELLKFIHYKESLTINNKKNMGFSKDEEDIAKQNPSIKLHKDNLVSKNLKNNFKILIVHEDFFEKLEKIMSHKKYTDEYKNRIKLLFFNFFNYLKETSINNHILKTGADGNIQLSLKRINICDVHSFINDTSKYKKSTSINYIHSVMRKYVRLLNCEPNLDYKEKIKLTNNYNNKDLSLRQQIVMIKFLKEKKDVQVLLIYYFLYYLGFTYSSTSRIMISHFLKNYNLLKTKKSKLKRFKINDSIRKNIINYIEGLGYEPKFLFYDNIKDSKRFTRVNFIKQKICNTLRKCYYIYNFQINYILNQFSKTRNPKKNTNNLTDFFDMDIGISNCYINSEISNFSKNDDSEESISISKDSSCIEKNEDNYNNNDNSFHATPLPNNSINLQNEFDISEFHKSQSDNSFEKEVVKDNIIINSFEGFNQTKNDF